jgi:hypothetical protein
VQNTLGNQRRFLDFVGEQIGVKNGDLSPWYGVSLARDGRRLGIQGIAKSKYGSIYEMLTAVYPGYPWVPWKFEVIAAENFKSTTVILSALLYVEQALHHEKPEDWYRVSIDELRRLRVAHLLTKDGSLYDTLQKYRPEVQWEESRFDGVVRFGSRLLGAYLRDLTERQVTSTCDNSIVTN